MKDYTPIGICRGVLVGDSISPDLRIRWYGRAQGFVFQNNDARDSCKPNLLKDDFDFSTLSPLVCGKIDSPDQGKFSKLPLPPPCCSESRVYLRMRALLFGSDSSGSVTIVQLLCNPESVSSQRRSSTPACAAALRSRSSRVASGSRSRRARSK